MTDRQRVALVTGAGGGIGKAAALEFAARGVAVVVQDLGVDLAGTGEHGGAAQAVADAIVGSGGQAIAAATDVSDYASVESTINLAVERFGGVDVVVNVAGILRDRMIFNMTEAEWDAVIAVHLKGTFNTVRHVSHLWRKQGDAQVHRSIVNIVSHSGLHGAPVHANYAAAKMGIVGLTYSSANALSRYGATVNALAPAANTRMTPARPDAIDDSARTPENVARVIGWLASPEAAWCTGQVVAVEGHQVDLYHRPAPIRRLVSREPWSPEDLAAQAEALFRPVVEAEPTWSRPKPGTAGP